MLHYKRHWERAFGQFYSDASTSGIKDSDTFLQKKQGKNIATKVNRVAKIPMLLIQERQQHSTRYTNQPGLLRGKQVKDQEQTWMITTTWQGFFRMNNRRWIKIRNLPVSF